MDMAEGTPSNPTSNNNNTNYVYEEVSETLTATTYTVPGGTFDLGSIRTPYYLELGTPATVSGGSVDYPNFSPSYAGQQHPFFGHSTVPKGFLAYFMLEAVNQADNSVTAVTLYSAFASGQYTSNGYYEAVSTGFSLQWQYNSGTTISGTSNGEIAGSSSVINNKSITLTAGDYKFRYKLKIGARSGRTTSTDSSGNTTTTFHTTTFSGLNYDLGSLTYFFQIIVPTNVIDLTSKGLQVLNDSDTYVQINRLGSGFSSQPTLINVKGGKVAIDGDDGSNAADLTAGYGQFTTGSFSRVDSFGYSAGSGTGGIGATMYPRTNNVYDVGSSNSRWDDIYATNGTINTSDRTLKTNISGSDLGLTFINNLEPVKYNFISGSRTHYGLIAQQVSESLASSSVHTDNFAGYIESHMYTSGGMDFDKKYITQQGWDINDFTISSTNLGLRYTEMIAPMVKAIQELTTRIEQLENE